MFRRQAHRNAAPYEVVGDKTLHHFWIELADEIGAEGVEIGPAVLVERRVFVTGDAGGFRNRYPCIDALDHRVAEFGRLAALVDKGDLRSLEAVVLPDRIDAGIGEHRLHRRTFLALAVLLLGVVLAGHIGDHGAKTVMATDIVASSRVLLVLKVGPDP